MLSDRGKAENLCTGQVIGKDFSENIPGVPGFALAVPRQHASLSLQPAGQPSIPPNMEVPVIRGVVLHLNDDPLAAPPAKDLVL